MEFWLWIFVLLCFFLNERVVAKTQTQNPTSRDPASKLSLRSKCRIDFAELLSLHVIQLQKSQLKVQFKDNIELNRRGNLRPGRHAPNSKLCPQMKTSAPSQSQFTSVQCSSNIILFYI